MKIITEFIRIFFFDLILKQRKWIISRSEKKIKKLEQELCIEKIYYDWLLVNTTKILNKGEC